MNMITLVGFSLVALTLLTLVKQYCPGYVVPLSVLCCGVVLLMALKTVSPVFTLASQLAAYAQWSDFPCVLKAVAITVLTQMAQDLCRETGQTALAGRVELAGKLCVLAAALPLFSTLANILLELLQ